LSNRFEERLNECLEALSSGQRTLEECLSRYPEDALRLEPMLRMAMVLHGSLAAQPRPEFAASARERFLRVTPPRLQEELTFEPRPSFVMAARQRFLAAAQRMAQEPKRAGRRLAWPAGWRPLRVAEFASAAAVVFVMGFGGFAVTTSADALPGDWRYPVKRTVEDVQYTLTFGEGGRQRLEIEYAHKRLSEIEKMAAGGRSIGEGPLKDLASQTGSLVSRLDNAQLHGEDARKVEDLGRQQLKVLSDAAPLVQEKASDELEQARSVSTEVYVKAAQVVMVEREKEGGLTAAVRPSPTAAPTAGGTPMAGSTGEEPSPTEGAEPADPAPSEPEVTPIPGAVVVVPVENENDAGMAWNLVVIDRFSVQVPAETSGWRLFGLTIGPDNVAEAPFMLRITNADATALVIINPRNGDTYWEQYSDGMFRELRARISDGPIVWQASEGQLAAFNAENATVVLRMVNSIKIEPPPTPTPKPSATPTPAGTEVASGVTATPSP